jgi:hypothetical protein
MELSGRDNVSCPSKNENSNQDPEQGDREQKPVNGEEQLSDLGITEPARVDRNIA